MRARLASSRLFIVRTGPLFGAQSAIVCSLDGSREHYPDPKIRDEIFEDAATLGGNGIFRPFWAARRWLVSRHPFRGRFFAVRAGIFESFRHRYAGGGSSFGFPTARQAPGITTALEWHLLPA